MPPCIRHRFAPVIARNLNEGIVHIRDMMERPVNSELEESDARIKLELDSWRLAGCSVTP